MNILHVYGIKYLSSKQYLQKQKHEVAEKRGSFL